MKAMGAVPAPITPQRGTGCENEGCDGKNDDYDGKTAVIADCD
jgi:hypothetical protein